MTIFTVFWRIFQEIIFCHKTSKNAYLMVKKLKVFKILPSFRSGTFSLFFSSFLKVQTLKNNFLYITKFKKKKKKSWTSCMRDHWNCQCLLPHWKHCPVFFALFNEIENTIAYKMIPIKVGNIFSYFAWLKNTILTFFGSLWNIRHLWIFYSAFSLWSPPQKKKFGSFVSNA